MLWASRSGSSPSWEGRGGSFLLRPWKWEGEDVGKRVAGAELGGSRGPRGREESQEIRRGASGRSLGARESPEGF